MKTRSSLSFPLRELYSSVCRKQVRSKEKSSSIHKQNINNINKINIDGQITMNILILTVLRPKHAKIIESIIMRREIC